MLVVGKKYTIFLVELDGVASSIEHTSNYTARIANITQHHRTLNRGKKVSFKILEKNVEESKLYGIIEKFQQEYFPKTELLNDIVITTYNDGSNVVFEGTIEETSNFSGVSAGQIRRVLDGQIKGYGGYKFKWKN